MASHSRDLSKHATTVEEVVTYIQETSLIGHLDLGSAEVMLLENDLGVLNLAITTSSGHAALLPADLFASFV
jgi:hypothetical protein